MAGENSLAYREYIITGFTSFTKKAIKHCRTCDHYYATLLTLAGSWVKSDFCLHWPEVRMGLASDQEYRESITKMKNGSCIFYRNRNSDHPYNFLRKNKVYYDMNEGII